METVKDKNNKYGVTTSNMHVAANSIRDKVDNKNDFVDLYWNWFKDAGINNGDTIRPFVLIKVGEFYN